MHVETADAAIDLRGAHFDQLDQSYPKSGLVRFNAAQRARAGPRYVMDAKTMSMHGLTLKPDCPLKI
jgi:hypothetical protein